MMTRISFELPVEDLRRSIAFYQTVFGWSMQSLPEVDYTLMTANEPKPSPESDTGLVIVGGLTPRTELVKAPVPIIGVSSVDEALAKVRQAGGKQLTEKERVGDFGFSSYVEDSEGNVLCLWEDM